MDEETRRLLAEASRVPGGYCYWGAASIQYCFPLKAGGELRIGVYDEDEPNITVHIDHYDGSLPPCITGPSFKTGEQT